MENIRELLEQKKEYYREIANRASKSLKKAPKSGNLRIIHSHGTEQYYLCRGGGDTNGTYIRKENRILAHQLAQRDYDKKILQSVDEKLDRIDRILKKTTTR